MRGTRAPRTGIPRRVAPPETAGRGTHVASGRNAPSVASTCTCGLKFARSPEGLHEQDQARGLPSAASASLSTQRTSCSSKWSYRPRSDVEAKRLSVAQPTGVKAPWRAPASASSAPQRSFARRCGAIVRCRHRWRSSPARSRTARAPTPEWLRECPCPH